MNFSDLTPEQQKKAKACNTPEEMLELAKEEGLELTDEQLEAVAGGWDECDAYTGDKQGRFCRQFR